MKTLIALVLTLVSISLIILLWELGKMVLSNFIEKEVDNYFKK